MIDKDMSEQEKKRANAFDAVKPASVVEGAGTGLPIDEDDQSEYVDDLLEIFRDELSDHIPNVKAALLMPGFGQEDRQRLEDILRALRATWILLPD